MRGPFSDRERRAEGRLPGRYTNRYERKPAERGAALLLFTLMLVIVVLPMIGLCIDGGVAYFAHARLSAATDAAALAGARSLNIGQDFASQKATAEQIAAQYFDANFPAGFFNATNRVVQATATESGDHTRTVQIQASADIELYFLGLLGHPTTHISAAASTSRRDVNVVLALDRSGSMSRVCGTMKSDAENFVLKFTNNRDTVGLVTFMGSANVDYPSNKSFKPDLNTTLNKLNCGGNTGSAAALSLAHTQLLNVQVPGALNAIVFFTDGVPNGFTAGPSGDGIPIGFPLKTGKTCNGSAVVPGYIAEGGGIYSSAAQTITSTSTPFVPGCPSGNFGNLAQSYSFIPEYDAYGNSASASGYSTVTRDSNNHIVFSTANSDAISINAADDAARSARRDGIFIYVIGLDGNGGVDSKLLQRIANDTVSPYYVPSQPAGRYFYSPNAGQLGAAFNAIASEILRISR